ncbi:GH92 family glycosyl hydrolase [Flavobacterium sp. SUN052]|uniref:GH92 family glycosyl hydrolase n=1 Tax=Flavobacterium sp. SUN052 TaxID=3002441 RepID=UPI00237DDB5F|nr:GH92 family glycosyl hydrolase [Flavobacterium sp. SUN052]MEC4004222.1 GH92 family glycosyl hydrolase [Flavobacterium sp. SUN052]
MKKRLFLGFLLFSISIFAQNYNQYVNPMIGTGGHGHTYPGATVPFGMVQLSPDTRIDGSWDGCSGYHHDDSVIYGFSHTHLNGTGCTDYGDIMLMPTMGEPSFNPKEYGSKFSHSNEKATAGFYSVKLDKNNIDVNLTASTRVGFHQYTFNNAGQATIILDLNHRDKLLYGDVKIIDNKTIQILRRSEAWAKDQYVYAQIEFSVPMKISKVEANQDNKSDFYSGTILKIAFSKEVKKGEKISVKVALSPTSYEGAKLNSSEIKGWDFNKVKKEAEQLWNKQLSKIEITESDKNKLAIFYTALYHTMVQPNIAQDIDGKYRGRDNKIHQAEGFDYYSVFSLWDTFRAAHPLYTLIEKKRTADFINTFLKQYEQGGRLPVWELASNETDCMIGYHSVSVMADAMAKGITGFDYEKAFEAAKHSAMLDHLGLDAYKKQGFISMDDEHESVSKTLEYAYDDWCIAQMAQILNKKSDYDYFMKRSQNWKNVFDWNTGFMRPKKNGGWEKPFDAKEINNNFTEGNSWQYSFFVPQDIEGMIQAYGGNEKFEAKLDEMFNAESKTTGREQADVTGLIGQYAHGNEPSHHMAYLYNYVGKPEKTAQKVHYILDNFYKNTPDGLIGNEDCGQMSAWYVLSSIGIYDITPAGEHWDLVKPHFEKVTIKNQIDVSTTSTIFLNLLLDSFDKFIPIRSFNGRNYITQKEKELDLLKRNTKFIPIIPVPVIVAESKSFKDNMKVSFNSYNKTTTYFYSVNNQKFQKFDKELTLNETSTIKFYSDNENGGVSDTISSQFFKKPNNYTINIKSKYNPQYHAGGPDGLLDGINGTENWRKGDWQGYQSQDFEAVVDLQNEQSVNEFHATFLQDSRSWILMPTKVDYYVSNDNINFTLAGTVPNDIDPKESENKIKDFSLKSDKSLTARYVKVIAYNFGKLPEWHQGAGGDAFIFIDEISFESKIKKVKQICEYEINFGVSTIIFFEKNKNNIDDSSENVLIEWAEILKKYPTMKFEIRSHCDSNEKNKENLSLQRGQVIFNYLVNNGINKNRLSIKSNSDSQLIFDCKTKECTKEQHQQNRRCEIIITEL